MGNTNQSFVFYVPGKNGIVDNAVKGDDGVFVSYHGKKTHDVLAIDYPGVLVGDFDVVLASQENALKTSPVLITEERFFDMLDTLPPEDWQRNADGESFKMCEHELGCITGIFVRIGKLYYEFNDDARLTHAEIIEKVVSGLKT